MTEGKTLSCTVHTPTNCNPWMTNAKLSLDDNGKIFISVKKKKWKRETVCSKGGTKNLTQVESTPKGKRTFRCKHEKRTQGAEVKMKTRAPGQGLAAYSGKRTLMN